MKEKTAIIIGAGPAGLTAAYEFITKSEIRPVVLESETFVGGISRTATYKGNRMDIGGHRFFSKDDRVTSLWTRFCLYREVLQWMIKFWAEKSLWSRMDRIPSKQMR